MSPSPAYSAAQPGADLFCRVIDNYGDIGVCWRLAQRLVKGRGWHVRLWVDDLARCARLAPGVDPRLAQQMVDGVELVHWTQPAPDLTPLPITLEAFACDPPPAYVARMPAHQVWVNLEYLSAENWIHSCHALPSPQTGGRLKHFFFPGFTPQTGGLLREPELLAARDALQADPAAREAFLARIGVPGEAAHAAAQGDARLVTLFCYPDAPVSGLVAALAANAQPTVLILTGEVAPDLALGPVGHVTRVRPGFLPQPDYDRLLWCADLNFVRGEDSFIRAHWAARPLVWHIYPQDEAAHYVKLNAWLAHYPAPEAALALNRAWNGELPPSHIPEAVARVLAPDTWPLWQHQARQWSDTLALQSDLADQLAHLCEGRLH
jgi:uncharacterized repeat protein (TIGR03837 family)